jgi:MFS family permease
MGAVPTLYGAGGSFFLFAIAEMIYSPRYYEYVSSFAIPGREGMTMGLALVPFGIGGLAGGLLSGRLIGHYLPKEGLKQPFHVWGTYAAIGAVAALLLFGFGLLFPSKPIKR